MEAKWVGRMMELAALVASWSKDPSTRVGAVIVDPFNRVVGTGYNGLPRGVEDTVERLSNRSLKYAMIVHSEVNAVLNSLHEPRGCALFVTKFPCNECCKVIIQAGIRTVYAPPETDERWLEASRISMMMLAEAGVQVHHP